MAKKSKRRNDPIDREEEEFQRRVRKRHIELFSEEYDHIFDSFAEARERTKGQSPLDAVHLEDANKRRVTMGFEPLSSDGYATSRDTFEYVEQKMRAGEEVTLTAASETGDSTPGDGKLDTTQAKQTAVKRKDAVADILASDAYLSKGDDPNDPEVIAVRILGALISLNSRGSNEHLFHKQIKREVPDQDNKEYQRLYRFAMNEWIEAYGG